MELTATTLNTPTLTGIEDLPDDKKFSVGYFSAEFCYQQDVTPGANRAYRLRNFWKGAYKKMSNYITTPLGEVFLPNGCEISGELTLDMSKMSTVTRNRVFNAVNTGLLKVTTGDAADLAKVLCKGLGLPLCAVSSRGRNSRMLVMNVQDEQQREDMILQTQLFMTAHGVKKDPGVRRAENGFYLFTGSKISLKDTHEFASMRMLEYTPEDKKEVRSKLSKILEDVPIIKIPLPEGGLRFEPRKK